MRGPVRTHQMDLSLKYQFVDRGGRYVFVMERVVGGEILGTIRLDLNKQTIVADPEVWAGRVAAPMAEKDPRQMELPLNVPE